MHLKTRMWILSAAVLGVVFAASVASVSEGVQVDAPDEKYRDTIDKGLAYLAERQAADGHWDGDGGRHPVAMTSLCGLALLVNRGPIRQRGDSEPPHAANVRKAVDWLLACQKKQGLFFSGHESETDRYTYGHGLAILFLAGAADREPADRRKIILDAVKRGVDYTIKSQSSRGGWFRTSKLEGHDNDSILATAVQIQALLAAKSVGVAVSLETLDCADGYLNCIDDRGREDSGVERRVGTAAALACRMRYFGWYTRDLRDESSKKWIKVCQAAIPTGRDVKFGRDELAHYFYAQALVDTYDLWPDYRSSVFDELKRRQANDGSWPASDGLGVGATYSTALWCIVLQLECRHHPFWFRTPESVRPNGDGGARK